MLQKTLSNLLNLISYMWTGCCTFIKNHYQKIWEWVKMVCIVVLFYFVWTGVASDFYNWYIHSDKTQWCKDIYAFLNGRVLVTIPICVVILCVAAFEIKKRLIDEDIRPWRLGGVMLIAIILNANCETRYPTIIGEIRFNNFINALLALYVLICCVGFAKSVFYYISKRIADAKRRTNNDGFSVDNEHEDNLPDNVKKYGETITTQLISTIKNEKDSFAVGITGEWGSGKTTFLNLLKKNLHGKAEVVDFNPWMCQSAEQVTRDFFSSLRHQLSRNHSSLVKPISHYAKHLDRVRVSLFSSIWIEGSNFTKSPSLFILKSELSSKFETLNKPVVIFIDDLDRLESKEVFEVLRLIRNTGDLRNTIYITAFDKEYVTAVLEDKGCYDPTAYLEKIFPVEIHLPKPESHQIWEVFREELTAQDNTGHGFANTLTSSLKGSDTDIILKILTNYRKAKRFSRLLMLNVNFIAKHYMKDFKYLDLFWLELLQFYDKHIYDILARDASELLYFDNSSNRYVLRQGISGDKTSKNDSHHYKGENTWKPLTPRILEILFGNYIKLTPLSISHPENYMKFFTIGLSAQKLSVNELHNLTDGKHNYKEVIDGWIEQGKYISSIEYNLRQAKVSSLPDSGLSNFLQGVMYYGLRKQSWKNRNLGFMNTILAKGRFGNEQRVHDIVMKWMKEQMKNSVNLIPLSWILKSLYATKDYEEEDSNTFSFNEKVISNIEIESLLMSIVKNYLEIHKMTVNPINILKKDNELFTLFDNCCLAREYVHMEGYTNHIQPSFDVIIDFFSSRKSKPMVNEYNTCLSELFQEKAPDPDSFEDPNEYYQWQENEEERYYNMMSSHFGNSYDEKLKEYKNKCFQIAAPPTPKDKIPQPKKSKTKTKIKIGSSSRSKIKGKRKKK